MTAAGSASPAIACRGPTLKPGAGASRSQTVVAAGIALSTMFAILLLSHLGACSMDEARMRATLAGATYPPAPQPPRAVALGNLRSGPAPSDAKVRMSLLLFGEEPESPLAFVRPLVVGLDRGGVLVCDAALGAVLRWDSRTTELKPARLSPRPARPVAAEIAPNGDVLVADARNAAVYRYDSRGELVLQYSTTNFRPAAMLSVGDEVWVTNVLGHRIEVFDAGSGRYLRSIGRRGGGAGEFGAPLGQARRPDGHVCVVDALNARVQVLNPMGEHVRTIGGPGDLVGYFGRPKGVAVGPDGTVFVTDAASQRVHAFDADGRALLAFPEPGRRSSDAQQIGMLSVPGGICISATSPLQDPMLPDGFEPAYYVLVAEQLLRPGVRVYAWGGSSTAKRDTNAAHSAEVVAPWREGQAVNPHWSASSCHVCHAVQGGEIVPRRLLADAMQPAGSEASIDASPATADALCLSCHDGLRALAESHPVGRIARTAMTEAPRDWPLVEGRLGCLTCHDVARHCDATVRRPTANSSMLRAYDAADPMQLCVQCHRADESWRTNPHRNLDADGQIIGASCTICHSQTPPIVSDGHRRNEPMLHVDGSQLCLTCHRRHWDVSPLGHIDRVASEATLCVMQARAAEGGPASGGNGFTPSNTGSPQHPLLPLSKNRVTCYTCHNPHQPGLFPDDSPMNVVSTAPEDAHASLRVGSETLCIECHAK